MHSYYVSLPPLPPLHLQLKVCRSNFHHFLTQCTWRFTHFSQDLYHDFMTIVRVSLGVGFAHWKISYAIVTLILCLLFTIRPMNTYFFTSWQLLHISHNWQWISVGVIWCKWRKHMTVVIPVMYHYSTIKT